MTISFNSAPIGNTYVSHEPSIPPKTLQSAEVVDLIIQDNLDRLRNTPIAQDATTVNDLVWQCRRLASEYEDAVLIILQKNRHIFDAVSSSVFSEETSLSDGDKVLRRLINLVSDQGFYSGGNKISRIDSLGLDSMFYCDKSEFDRELDQIVVPKKVAGEKYFENSIGNGQLLFKKDKKDKNENMSYVRYHFLRAVENNPAHHKIPARCAEYLLKHGVVEFCKMFSEVVRHKLIPEHVALEILQSEMEDSKGVRHGLFGRVLTLQSSKDDIKEIYSLLGKFNPKSIVSLLCGDGVTGGLVLRNLVVNGMVKGVENFSSLMKDLERRIGPLHIRNLMLNNVDLLGASLAAGSSSIVEALGKMYLHFSCSDELGVSLVSSPQLASAINKGHVGALRAYCALVEDVARFLRENKKAKILKAMRNAQLQRGFPFFVRTQRPEFKKLCADNKDFYATYKSAKNSVRP